MNIPDARKALYVRMDPAIKARIMVQAKRLNVSIACLTKMAMIKFVEEEERIEAGRQ